MRRLALLFVAVAGCARESPANEPAAAATAQPASAPIESPVTPATPAPKPTTHVELIAVTLADDCGGTPPWGPPAKVMKAEAAPSDDGEGSPSKAKAKADYAGARAKRRCEQTSMQLSIAAGDTSSIKVKSVELFDQAGTSLGKLTASKPTRWSDASGMYEAWDENVAAGSTTSVSYVLSQPNWDQIGDRWNKTYTLKTVLSVGGVDQTAQRDVSLSAPTTLPPNVKT